MKRLLEDASFSAELRADLLRSRSAGQDYQTAAKLLQLRAAFSDNPPPAPAPLQRVLRRGVHPGWKLAVIAALGGGAGFWAFSAARVAQVDPQVAAEYAQKPAPPPAEALPPPAASTRAPLAVELQPAADLPASRPADAEPPPAAARTPTRRAADGSSSRREIAQLVRIRALLERDPAAALRLAQRGEREFPRGILAEERQALSIVALASAGDKEHARRQAQQFFVRYPQSPLRESVEAALR